MTSPDDALTQVSNERLYGPGDIKPVSWRLIRSKRRLRELVSGYKDNQCRELLEYMIESSTDTTQLSDALRAFEGRR